MSSIRAITFFSIDSVMRLAFIFLLTDLADLVIVSTDQDVRLATTYHVVMRKM